MLKLIYTVAMNRKETEVAWLRAMRVYPALEEYWLYTDVEPKKMVRIGVIVGEESALAIKLRHNLETQCIYRPK